MGLREWIEGLRHREDASAIRRAQEMGTETPEERAISAGDIEGMAADESAQAHGDGLMDEESAPDELPG